MKKIISYEAMTFVSVNLSEEALTEVQEELLPPVYYDEELNEGMYSADRDNYPTMSETLEEILDLCDEHDACYFRIEKW